MFRVTLIAFALVALIAPSTQAQNAVLSELYGRGVHAYFRNDYTTANDYLSKAIDGGIKDPRAYYFRGLTVSASGDGYSAESDYRAGAEMEAAGSFANIGSALTRIQGSCRTAIEDIRQQARLEYQAAAATRSKARYGDIEAAGDDVLRGKPADKKLPMAPKPAPPAIPPAADNPFSNDGASGEPKVESRDTLEGTMKADPFADDAMPAPDAMAPPASDDPFGGGAKPAADADPFGAGAKPAADADPFGAGGAADPFSN